MTEKVPQQEKSNSDFEIAQKDLRSAFANVNNESWLYKYRKNLEAMVMRGDFEQARDLLQKKQSMPDTATATKSEIQNILNAIDLYEPESIKQKSLPKSHEEIIGKDGPTIPEKMQVEEATVEKITEENTAHKKQRPRIQKIPIEKSIREKTTKDGKPTNAYSTTKDQKQVTLEQGEMRYDDEENFEHKWQDEILFTSEETLEARDLDRISHWQIDKKNRVQELEEQDQKTLLERTTNKIMSKEQQENSIEKVPTPKPEGVISEAEQRQIIYAEMKSLGADEALLKKASEVAIEDAEEMLGALQRKKKRESLNTTIITPENKNESKEPEISELEKELTTEKILQLQSILKKGGFVFVAPATKWTPPGGEEIEVPITNLSTKVAAHLLQEAGIQWKETKFILPNQQNKKREIFSIDGNTVYINSQGSGSTAEYVDTMLKKCGLWEKGKENADWKKNLVSFVNGVDNMILPGRSKEYMTKTFPKTLYGTESILAAKDFNAFIQLFKDGHKGEDILPENIQNMIVRTEKRDPEGNFIRDKNGKIEYNESTLLEKVTHEIEGSYNGMAKAKRQMAESRIPSYVPMFGNILVNKMVKNNKKETSYISRREVIKDAGLTNITIYEGKGFFVSGTGKSLEKSFEEIKKVFPEAQLVRGTMILCFPEKEAFNQDKMREALGLNYEQVPLDEKLSQKDKESAIESKIKEVTTKLEKFKNKDDRSLSPQEWNEKRALETKLQGYQFQKEDLLNPPKQKEDKEKNVEKPKEGQKNIQETNKQQELWNQAVAARKEYEKLHELRHTFNGTPEEAKQYISDHYNAWLKTDHYIKMLRGETTEPFKPVSKEEALRIVREGFNKGTGEALSTPEKQEQKAPVESKDAEEKREVQKTPAEKQSPARVLEETNVHTNSSIKVEKAREEVTKLTQDIEKLKGEIQKREKQGFFAKLFGGKRKLRENKETLAKLELEILGQDERIHPVRHLFIKGMSEDVRINIFGNGNPTLETISPMFTERDETQDTLKAFNNIVDAKDNIVYFTPSGFTLRLRNKNEITDKDGIRVNDPKALYDLVDPRGQVLQKGINIEQGESLLKEAARIYREKMQTSK